MLKYLFDRIKMTYRYVAKYADKIITRTMAYIEYAILFFRYKNHQQKKINICITTSKNYFSKTIKPLITQMKILGIPLRKVYVFEGGYFENKKINQEFNHYQVNHNSFDLTSLISIVELNLKSEYWLLLHDTIELRKDFKMIFFTLNPSENDCMPLRDFPSMNIGVYSQNYLMENADYLLSLKNVDYSESGLQKMKQKSVKDEDFLFRLSKKKRIINSWLNKLESVKMSEYNGQPRYKEIYPQLGITKYKANNKQLPIYVIGF